jgi:hypothetical protein
MSAPVDKLWSQVGTVYKTKEDIYLASQLAACKAGFSVLELSKDYCPGPPFSIVRCIGFSSRGYCKKVLVRAEMVSHISPAQGWRIVEVKPEHLEAARHPKHSVITKLLEVSRLSRFC